MSACRSSGQFFPPHPLLDPLAIPCSPDKRFSLVWDTFYASSFAGHPLPSLAAQTSALLLVWADFFWSRRFLDLLVIPCGPYEHLSLIWAIFFTPSFTGPPCHSLQPRQAVLACLMQPRRALVARLGYFFLVLYWTSLVISSIPDECFIARLGYFFNFILCLDLPCHSIYPRRVTSARLVYFFHLVRLLDFAFSPFMSLPCYLIQPRRVTGTCLDKRPFIVSMYVSIFSSIIIMLAYTLLYI